jgi:nucleosome assembly protein 1-like 1
VTKTVKNDSFFNFFDPPAIPDDPEAEVDAETQDLMTADFELGHYIRERIVPRAVLYFTGKLVKTFRPQMRRSHFLTSLDVNVGP